MIGLAKNSSRFLTKKRKEKKKKSIKNKRSDERLTGQVFGFEVAVGEGDEPPEAGEGQPAQHEAEGEDEAGPAPLDVHHGRKNVGQVAAPAFGHVRLHHVALAVLHDDALAHPPRAPSVLSVPGCCCCFCFFFAIVSSFFFDMSLPKSSQRFSIESRIHQFSDGTVHSTRHHSQSRTIEPKVSGSS